MQPPQLVLTEHEQNLIRYVRLTGFGMLTVEVQNNEPVRIETVVKSIKL